VSANRALSNAARLDRRRPDAYTARQLTPDTIMRINKFYAALAALAAWAALGLTVVAPWLFATFDARTAFTYDLFGLIVPFVALSVYVISQRRLAPKWLGVLVTVLIVILWIVTARNVIVIIHAL